MWRLGCILFLFAAGLHVHAQGTVPAGAVRDYPFRTIQFGAPKPTTLGSRKTGMTALTGCSDDGVAFVLMTDDLTTSEMVVHSVDADGKSVPVVAHLPAVR
jgi:hypothetical protein